jgi:hypothetical protein
VDVSNRQDEEEDYTRKLVVSPSELNGQPSGDLEIELVGRFFFS